MLFDRNGQVFPRLDSTSRCICFVLIATMTGGCSKGPYDLAPTSGIVTLEGEPLGGATVTFAPKGDGSKTILGPGSLGTTDENGRYVLETFKEEHGAVVGKHTVTITTFKQEFVDFKTSDEVRTISQERVPKHYNEKTILSYDVPPSGTSEANFALTLEKP